MAEAMPNTTNELTRGSRLSRNTVLNLVGQCAPLVVAIFAIPLLIRGLGTDRFGVLTLAWVVIGYFSLFDLGLSRALTMLVAEKLGGAGREQVGTLFMILLCPWVVRDVLNIPEVLQPETLKVFYLLGLSLTVVITSTCHLWLI